MSEKATTEEVRTRFANEWDSYHGWQFDDSQAERFERWLEEHDREVEQKALLRVADDLEFADDPEQFRNSTEEAPKGWTDETIASALDTSGVITDWLRAKASKA